MYFVISNCEGEPSIHTYDEEGIQELLEEYVEEELDYTFMDAKEMKEKYGGMEYWGYDRVIIKGEIVKPKPTRVVTKFKI